MAIVQPDRLLIDYDLFKSWNGFVLPKINDDDTENGITTPEIKFQKWSTYVQDMLNVTLQEELDNIDFNLENVKPAFQKSLIKIMVTRLNRAFYNDEILPRDSQVQVAYQGGVQYSSTGSIDPKSSVYSFWNGPERQMIESSGLIEDTFAADEDDDFDAVVANQFKSGELVPDVDLNEFQRVAIVYNGVNTTVLQALNSLNADKQSVADLTKAIEDATGLTTDAVTNKITVLQNKYIEYLEYRANKTPFEVAQVQDVQDAEARGRADIVVNQKQIAALKNVVAALDERVQILEAIEQQENIVNIPENPYDLVGTAAEGTLDIKTILVDNPAYDDSVPEDPITNPSKIAQFNDFSDKAKWTVQLYDANLDQHKELSFRRDTSATYTIASGNQSDTFKVIIDANGILTVTRTNGNANVANNIKVSEIAQVTELNTDTSKQLVALINQRVKKQWIQGANADWETFDDLRALVKDNDFVSISFAQGSQIAGIVTAADVPGLPVKAIEISGFKTVNGEIISGVHEIDENLGITSFNILDDFAKKNLSNVDVIQIFEGQILSFNKQKVNGPFADKILFSEKAVPNGIAISNIHIIPGASKVINNQNGINFETVLGGGITKPFALQTIVGGNLALDNSINASGVGTLVRPNNLYADLSTAADKIDIKYVYTALKDITFAEMGK